MAPDSPLKALQPGAAPDDSGKGDVATIHQHNRAGACWALSRGELSAWALLILFLPLVGAFGTNGFFRSSGNRSGPGPELEVRVVTPSDPRGSSTSTNTSPPNKISTLTTPASSAKLDLNSASSRALELLPGIGPKRAERIVQYRSAHGPFSTVSALSNVPGLPKSLTQKLEAYLSVESGTTPLPF